MEKQSLFCLFLIVGGGRQLGKVKGPKANHLYKSWLYLRPAECAFPVISWSLHFCICPLGSILPWKALRCQMRLQERKCLERNAPWRLCVPFS